MFCPKCGTQSADGARFCISCGLLLEGIPGGASAAQDYPDAGLGALIPYKNSFALVSYYLGVFSIIPGFGILLSVPAVVLGVMGLKKFKAEPRVRGKVHAWVGIIAGAGFALLQVGLVVALTNL